MTDEQAEMACRLLEAIEPTVNVRLAKRPRSKRAKSKPKG